MLKVEPGRAVRCLERGIGESVGCCVLAVVVHLGLEPIVKGGSDLRIGRSVDELCAIRSVLDLDGQLVCGGAQGGEARHLGAVDGSRVVELAASERLCFLSEVLLDKCDLAAVVRTVGCRGLARRRRRWRSGRLVGSASVRTP